MPVTHFEKTLQQRQIESKKVKQQHPDRACIYMVKSTTKPTLPDLDKNKYLVPLDITIGQFAYIIRKRIRLCPSTAMFLLINNTIVASGSTIAEAEKKYVNEDGFLYIHYTTENCFG
jgi:GABA(A) receptor-associated protein